MKLLTEARENSYQWRLGASHQYQHTPHYNHQHHPGLANPPPELHYEHFTNSVNRRCSHEHATESSNKRNGSRDSNRTTVADSVSRPFAHLLPKYDRWWCSSWHACLSAHFLCIRILFMVGIFFIWPELSGQLTWHWVPENILNSKYGHTDIYHITHLVSIVLFTNVANTIYPIRIKDLTNGPLRCVFFSTYQTKAFPQTL